MPLAGAVDVKRLICVCVWYVYQIDKIMLGCGRRSGRRKHKHIHFNKIYLYYIMIRRYQLHKKSQSINKQPLVRVARGRSHKALTVAGGRRSHRTEEPEG